MTLETVGQLEDIPEKEGFLFRSGPHQIALFRIGETVSAIDTFVLMLGLRSRMVIPTVKSWRVRGIAGSSIAGRVKV